MKDLTPKEIKEKILELLGKSHIHRLNFEHNEMDKLLDEVVRLMNQLNFA